MDIEKITSLVKHIKNLYYVLIKDELHYFIDGEEVTQEEYRGAEESNNRVKEMIYTIINLRG
jgi:hypothetical protein